MLHDISDTMLAYVPHRAELSLPYPFPLSQPFPYLATTALATDVGDDDHILLDNLPFEELIMRPFLGGMDNSIQGC